MYTEDAVPSTGGLPDFPLRKSSTASRLSTSHAASVMPDMNGTPGQNVRQQLQVQLPGQSDLYLRSIRIWL